MNIEPCMCGCTDCPQCYPYRENDSEQMTEQEEYEAELAYEQQLWKDTGC